MVWWGLFFIIILMNDNHFQISDDDFWYQIEAKLGKSGGVYILKSGRNKRPYVINRFLDADHDGRLYIGKAGCFLDRVIELKKSLSPNHVSAGHECGERWKKHIGIQEKYPYVSLFVELKADDHPRARESALLEAYMEQFGEYPPLNRVS